ncbi:phospholipase D family protein [Salinimicrobium flavum]|uniref:Phospholipase D family protein n=1 Tax=Salinimicrobium flavum TaxID=1737065 RepID=A0ABW5J1A9_9FLAO
MALFLNTNKLNYWIPKLISEAESELILIVPYIKVSQKIVEALQQTDEKGVDITLVYRENKLSESEKSKLTSFQNLTLLHHPNIHCKCYYNGDLLILGSMNLYEYSEKNNREMGVLLHQRRMEDLGEAFNGWESDSKKIFDDAILEIKEIINGAQIEKLSDKGKAKNFKIEIIKTDEELEIERCERFNKYFLNKKFKAFEETENNWLSKCENYFDKVDVLIENNRIAIRFNLPEGELKGLYQKWMSSYQEYEFPSIKYYWNYHTSSLLIYRDYKSCNWDELGIGKEYHQKLIAGIDNIISKYRILTGK